MWSVGVWCIQTSDTSNGSSLVRYSGISSEAVYFSVLGSKCAIICVTLCVPCKGLFLECQAMCGSITIVRVSGCTFAAILAW